MRNNTRTIGALAIGVILAAAPAWGQTVGFGASPGRASYRPESQWNNGPFYTAPHVDPYRPHGAPFNGHYHSEPIAPPYDLAPHGRYSTFSSGEGALRPYEQAFSPLSNYAGWYQRTYNFKPTDNDIARARTEFFRSAPLSAYVAVLPPIHPTAPLPTPPPLAAALPSEFKQIVVPKPAEPAARPAPKQGGVAVYGTMLKARR